MDRRVFLGAGFGALSTLGTAGRANAQETDGGDVTSFTSGGRAIAVEWFAPAGAVGRGPGLLMLHGAEGLALAAGYRLAAGYLAQSGYRVAFVHYLERTGDRRVAFSELRTKFPLWTETVADAVSWLGGRPGVDPGRLGIVGISLGAALAFQVASADGRVRAIVDYFGLLPEGLAARSPRLPPTLILHGDADRIVPIAKAREIEALLGATGVPYETVVYPGEGHGFGGAAQLDSAGRVGAFLSRHL